MRGQNVIFQARRDPTRVFDPFELLYRRRRPRGWSLEVLRIRRSSVRRGGLEPERRDRPQRGTRPLLRGADPLTRRERLLFGIWIAVLALYLAVELL